jgi:LemA protein
MSAGIFIFLAVMAVGLIVVFINIYNSLVFLRNQVERAWSNIDVILKQRFDEIPQLIQVVEQYTGHEANVLQELFKARAHYGQAQSIPEKIGASQELSFALRGILAISEAYPDLKSNSNFLQLQSRVSDLESSIADRRESYNEAVTNFNARLEQFPDLFAARMLNYQRQQLFVAAEQEKTAPSLKMNLPKFGKGA